MDIRRQQQQQEHRSLSMSLVGGYALHLLVGVMRQIAPMILVCLAVGAALLSVPLGLSLSPALLVVASPVLALLLVACALLLWLRRIDEGWRSRVDWALRFVLPSSSFYSSSSSSSVQDGSPAPESSILSRSLSYARSWVPSFLLSSVTTPSNPATATADLDNVHVTLPSTHSSTPLLLSNRTSIDRDRDRDRDSLYSNDRHPNSLPIEKAPPKVVFKSLNPVSDGPLLVLCNSLLNSKVRVQPTSPAHFKSFDQFQPQQKPSLHQHPSTASITSSSSSSTAAAKQNNVPSSKSQPSVRLGRMDSYPHNHTPSSSSSVVEFKVLTVWRKDVKDILMRREYARLFVEDLVAFVEVNTMSVAKSCIYELINSQCLDITVYAPSFKSICSPHRKIVNKSTIPRISSIFLTSPYPRSSTDRRRTFNRRLVSQWRRGVL
ncbi:hypothetical protein CcCBS67573_g01635 [Chytriomyces confervae]|uniref:Uncharacterized protein n=1 Tax=Chytriomyces confervae TaxID=246404 RepID=A0A507FLE1_9FUNG|nr:hypothetical protein CcCBS67573_g01635 [Chytriomyces confervae]